MTVRLCEGGKYGVEIDVLEEKITEKTKMIWVSNPCNPTGHVFSKRDLENIAEVAQEHNLIVFADEIYEKLTYDGVKNISIGSLPGVEDRTITVNGFSKAYAMTGWRIGYIVAERSSLQPCANCITTQPCVQTQYPRKQPLPHCQGRKTAFKKC